MIGWLDTLNATAEINGLNPEAYFRSFIARIADLHRAAASA